MEIIADILRMPDPINQLEQLYGITGQIGKKFGWKGDVFLPDGAVYIQSPKIIDEKKFFFFQFKYNFWI